MKRGLTRYQRRKLKARVQQAGFGAVVILIFMFASGRSTAVDVTNGLLVTAIMALVTHYLAEHAFPRFRRWPLVVNVLAVAGLYHLVLITLVGIIVWCSRALERSVSLFDGQLLLDMRRDMFSPFFLQAYSVGFGVFVCAAFVFELSRKLGPGVLRDWMLGRYRSPRQEERIFMFLDLKGSTTLAEELGDLKFSGLVQECFARLGEPVVEHGGEISHYIGDEVVISWPMSAADDPVRCFFSCRDVIGANADGFLLRYGHIPEFKAGLHCGSVVAAEVGDVKSEIVYQGDVLNTTSRIQGLCRETGYDLLVSDELWRRVGSTAPAERLGAFELKGKRQALELVGLSPVVNAVAAGNPL